MSGHALYGVKAVIVWLEQHYDYYPTRQSLWLLRHRPTDPLPFRDVAGRKRVCVHVEELRAWSERNLVPQEPTATVAEPDDV